MGCDLHRLAIGRIRERREFSHHLAIFVVLNFGLGLIWICTTPGDFYWPVFPLLM